MAASMLPPEVPAGWSAQWSEKNQTWLFIDLKSLNIQWMRPMEPPPGHVPTPPVSPVTPSRGQPSVPAGWKPKWHVSYGAWYYVNSQTGKSQWNRPHYAAIPANDYSPVDYTHRPAGWDDEDLELKPAQKPVNWDECAPSPLVPGKAPKLLPLSLNLDRQPILSGFEHLFTNTFEPIPLTPGFFSPPPPKAAPPSPPRLSIDTKNAQTRQRPVSPTHTFIPGHRPRAISDCPPFLPDVPPSQIGAPHPEPLNPYAQVRHSFLMPPGPAPNTIARRSLPPAAESSLSYAGGYGSAYAPPAQQAPPRALLVPGVPIQKVNTSRGHHRWASSPNFIVRKPLTPTIETVEAAPPPKDEKQKAIHPVTPPPEEASPPLLKTPAMVLPPPPPEPVAKPRPLSEISQLLRTKTVGYSQGSWPIGAQDRGYYPTKVDEREDNANENDGDGYESDSSYCTDYADDEPERSPAVNFTPVVVRPAGRESWELSY